VSTSLNLEVAMMYLGTDPDRDIMLEIWVDKTLLDSESSPFADIQAVSAFPDEQEVLLPMGITLQVQSVTISSQNKNMSVQARLYYKEDATMKELRTYLQKRCLPYGRDESFYVNTLLTVFFEMGDHERFEKYAKLVNSSNENVVTMLAGLQNLTKNTVEVLYDMDESDLEHKMFEMIQFTVKMLQDILHNLSLPDYLRDRVLLLANIFSSCSSEKISDMINNLNLLSVISECESFFASPSVPLSYPLLQTMQTLKAMLNSFQGNHAEALKHWETGCTSSFVSENGIISPSAQVVIASSVAALGDDDRCVRILEDLHNAKKPEIHVLVELAEHYRKIGDMPMVIEYYRSVIEDCNLPPNSIAIVKAYYSIGTAFQNLYNNKLALSNYYRARQLLLQHHPPTHSFLTRIEKRISLAEAIRRLEELP
jgi:hypothetical protein